MERPGLPDDSDESAVAGAQPNSVTLNLVVKDVDVLAALAEYPEGRRRNEFAEAALKVGVLALRTTRGMIDGDTVRRESDRLLELLAERLDGYGSELKSNVAATLTEYFDPESGRFPERVNRLVRADGELATVMQSQLASAQSMLETALLRHLGEESKLLSLLTPDESNQLLAAIKGSVDQTLSEGGATIVREFSLDRPDSALSRLVRELETKHGSLAKALSDRIGDVVAEFSLDNEDSALSRLVGRVEDTNKRIGAQFSLDNQDSALSRLRREMQDQLKAQADASAEFQQKVLGILDRLDVRRAEAARSTRHGMDFEAEVEQFIERTCKRTGDVFESVGATTGVISHCKVGDFIVTLGPDCVAAGARIVVEAKENTSYTMAKTLEEADKARRNRSAGVSLFVHSKRTAPTGCESLMRFGDDLVVVWDAEDETSDVVLQAGLMCAKAVSIKEHDRALMDGADLDAIDRAIESIRKSVEGLSDIRTSSNTIKTSAQRIDQRAERMQHTIAEGLQELSEHAERLRSE